MKKFFQNILLWLYIKMHSVMIYISIALYNTEQEILKADPNDLDEKNNHTQRMRSRNPLLEKFYAGNRDEKYVKDYYEVLKKADKFIRNATPHQMAVAADKYGTSYGMKDQYGRRYEHYGFFDDKHKNAGKTLGEVLENEYLERRTKDDDLEIMYIFNNKPIEVGFVKVLDVVEKSEKENIEFEVSDMYKKSKQFEFPIKAYRDDENVENKIEQLTEYLHVKKIGFEFRQLEFFIPLKFKTMDIEENSKIFEEITNIKSIFVKNDYGELMGFGIIKLMKRIKHNDTHEVWKFEGIEMQTVGQ
jgi:hypothetical protein